MSQSPNKKSTSNKRTHSASVSPSVKPVVKFTALEVLDPEPRFFAGPYSQFVQMGPWFYRLRKYRTLQSVMEALKPHFKLYCTRYKIETIEGKRYLCYSAVRNSETGKVFDVIPYNLVWQFDFDAQFEAELRAVYFFRFVMGFRTLKSSLEVVSDGRRYHPLSAVENAFCHKPVYSMPDYRISPVELDSDEKGIRVLWISPQAEMKRILGSLSASAFHDFIGKIRNTLRDVAPKYVYLANNIRELLLELIEFGD
jgi:hypothetical protein